MAKFEIFAGMGGSFGGAVSYGIFEFNDWREAEKYAYMLAEEEYQSYEGCHGILSWDECRSELIESGYAEDEIDSDDVDDYYREEVESWITYEAVEIPDDTPLGDREE